MPYFFGFWAERMIKIVCGEVQHENGLIAAN
jgi:hypothetical protein